MQAITGIDFITTDKCNLRCGFCYGKKNRGKGYSRERAEAALRFLLKQEPASDNAPRKKTWAWWGGEPLLCKSEIQEFVKVLHAQPHIEWACEYTTNLVNLDEAFLEWSVENNVHPFLSFDGCREAHDTHRKFADGTGSFDVVERNAKMVLRHFKQKGVRATISPETVPWFSKSVRYLHGLGFWGIETVHATGAAWDETTLQIFEDQLRIVTDFWLGRMRLGDHFSVYHLSRCLPYLWKPTRTRGGVCYAGHRRVGVDTSGGLWPCHRYAVSIMNDAHSLGDIYNGFSEEGLARRQTICAWDNRTNRGDGCDECAAVNVCKFHCLADSAASTGNPFKTESTFCRFVRAYHREALRAHAIMIREDNHLYRRLYDPTRRKKKK